MTGWEFEDLMKVLEDARGGNKTHLEELTSKNPFAKANQDLTKLLVLRKFQAEYLGEDDDPLIFIHKPTGKNFQYGISVITTPEDGEVDFTIYIPNKYSYTGIEFDKDEITIVSMEMTKKTNIRELHKKLRKFCPQFKQADLELAFDSLINEIYKLKKVPKAVKTGLVIENSFLGTLTYDKDFDWYANNRTSKYFKFEMNINYEVPHKFAELLKYVETKMVDKFYETHLVDIEPEMIKLKNDSWLEDEEEQLTPEKFRRLVAVTSIVFYHNKSCTIYCSDGGLFGGHTIAISVGKSGTYKGVALTG
jgi:hypothetical protein